MGAEFRSYKAFLTLFAEESGSKSFHPSLMTMWEGEDMGLLSHSVTPEIDSVPQLKKYALEKGVKDKKWNLVTGDKRQIYNLARKSYLAVKTDGDGGPYDMIHTENFILVDKEKRIRGTYDGTNPEEIETLLSDLRILQASYND